MLFFFYSFRHLITIHLTIHIPKRECLSQMGVACSLNPLYLYKCRTSYTFGVQCLQVFRATDRLHHPRLVHCTLHLPPLPPLLGAQIVVVSGSVGPIGVLLCVGGLREHCAVLKPGHGHFLWVETLQVTVKSEGNVAGV